MKLENPFKDEFDDDFDFDSGAPSFIPNFDNIEVDFDYDDYDPYSASVLDNPPATINFREEKKSQQLNSLPKLFQDSHGASVLIAPPPKPSEYFFRNLPENRELPHPKRPYSHSETPQSYHPFKTTYKESFGNYGKKRLEFNPLITPNYEESLVKEPETPTSRRVKKNLQTREHYQEKNIPHYAERHFETDFKGRDIPEYNNEYTLRGSAELAEPSVYNSPREPFGPPTSIHENAPFLKSQDYGRDVLRFSSRSDGYHDGESGVNEGNMYAYSEDFDPFKELEKEGVHLFGEPFESNTEQPEFSDFGFQKRSGQAYRPSDLFAEEAGGGKRKRNRKENGPRSRSLGDSLSYSRAGSRRGRQGLSRHDGVSSFTTPRPFAYTTSPKVGIQLGDENIRRIHKSFIFGEKSNADF